MVPLRHRRRNATTTITTAGNFPTQASLSRWRSQNPLADVAAAAAVDGVPGATTPAASTGTLNGLNELVIAFAALHTMFGTVPNTPVWSAGYTNITSDASGTTNTDIAAFVGYNNNAGLAPESPNVTWTGSAGDRYLLVQTFSPIPQIFGTAALTGAGALSPRPV